MGLVRKLVGAEREERHVPWPDRLPDLLEAGESVEAEVPLGEDAAVVVTGRRVLAFSPRLTGPNFKSVDRPNVDGIHLGATAPGSYLQRAASFGLLGVVGLLGGMLVDFDALLGDVELSTGAAGQIGAGGLMGLVQTVLDLFALMDEVFLVGGALATIAGVAFVVAYLRGRTPTIVLEVAGGEDIHLPRPADPGDAKARVEAALGFRPPPDDGGRGPNASSRGPDA